MKENPVVSVVVPCYNRAHYLRPTIDSILMQDYPHVECIVVDGGSKDGTVEILESYGDRIRWISEPDEGHADAINKGWKMSRGDILAWLNADDMYADEKAISSLVAILGEREDVSVVYGDHQMVNPSGSPFGKVIRGREYDFYRAVLYCDYVITQPASLIRRSILEKVGWLDATFTNGKDHELWNRIGLQGTILHVPRLIAYERADAGLSQQADMGAAKIRIIETFLQREDLPELMRTSWFRRRAMSNACLRAAQYSIEAGFWRQGCGYIWRAMCQDFKNLPYVVRKTGSILWFVMIVRPRRRSQGEMEGRE